MATGTKSLNLKIINKTENIGGDAVDAILRYVDVTITADTGTGKVKVACSSRSGNDYASDPTLTVSHGGSSQTFTAGKGNSETFTFTLKKGNKVVFTTSHNELTVYIHVGSSATDYSSYSVDLPVSNSLPTAYISVPTLFAGKTAKITWSTSDADGDTVYTTSLVRYMKRSGQSTFSEQTTLISSQTTATSFTDTIPSDAGGAQIYYYLAFTDNVGATQYKQSSTATVYTNTAPTAPGSLLVSGDLYGSVATGGGNVTISWTASSDVDGNLSGYELEKQENGGSWTQIYKGSAREYSTTVTEGLSTIRYRVRAYDSMGATSSYTTGTAYTVNNNKAPVITIKNIVTDGSIGVFDQTTGAPVLAYTVTDPENTVMTVEEYLDGVLLKSEETSGGNTRTISFTEDAWIRVLNGEHVFRIVAKDADGSVGSAEVRFTKDVDRIEIILKTAMESDTMPTLLMVNVQGLIPAGAVLSAYATNNANDASPVWENISSAVLSREKHIFANASKTASKWAVNVRIILERGDAESVCAITSVGGNWK